MYFKLSEAMLCPDCNIIFKTDNQRDGFHYPVCPICCNKAVLNVGNVLNRTTKEKSIRRRKEVKNEKTTAVNHNRVDMAFDDSSGGSIGAGSSGGQNNNLGAGKGDDRRCCLEGWDGGAEPENSSGDSDGQPANRIIKTVSALFNVVRKFLQVKSDIKSKLQRIDAGSLQRIL